MAATQNKAQSIRYKLFNPANKSTQVGEELLQKRLRNALAAVDSLRAEIAVRDAEIAELKLDLSDRNARVLSQAKQICSMLDEDDVGEVKMRRSVREIMEEVLKDYPGITVEQIVGVQRSRFLVEPRQMCHYRIFKERTDLSTVKIGRLVKRDHSVIFHSVRKVEAKIHGQLPSEQTTD